MSKKQESKEVREVHKIFSSLDGYVNAIQCGDLDDYIEDHIKKAENKVVGVVQRLSSELSEIKAKLYDRTELHNTTVSNFEKEFLKREEAEGKLTQILSWFKKKPSGATSTALIDWIEELEKILEETTFSEKVSSKTKEETK